MRVYASRKWKESKAGKAGEEEQNLFPSEGRPIETDAEFFDAFKKLLIFGTGYPVLKYGRGKIVKRNLQIDHDLSKLSWVCMRSKKGSVQSPGKNTEKERSMLLNSIQSVDRDPFADTPPDSTHLCLAFRVPVDGKSDVEKVLKVICFYEIDVIVLQHGFAFLHKLLQSKNNSDSSSQSSSWFYDTFFAASSSSSSTTTTTNNQE